jgi:hypothetical protein
MTNALVYTFTDSISASIEADRRKDLGWNVVQTGPVDGLQIWNNAKPKKPTEYTGTWIVFASKSPITVV